MVHGLIDLPHSPRSKTMRYMTLWRPAKVVYPPSEKLQAEMGAFISELMKSGKLVDTNGWDPRSPCVVMKRAGDSVTITDGPYTEAKEMIGGYAILEAKSKEEVLELTRRFVAIAGDGTSEIRELSTF
jgi:hypothetical protein